jgi:hypothetical protein
MINLIISHPKTESKNAKKAYAGIRAGSDKIDLKNDSNICFNF